MFPIDWHEESLTCNLMSDSHIILTTGKIVLTYSILNDLTLFFPLQEKVNK